MNYVALASISELDEIYYNTIKSPLKDELEDKDFELPIKNFRKGMLKHGLHWFDIFLFRVVAVMRFFYVTIYFYMFPMFLYVFIYIEYGIGDSIIKTS